MICDCGSPSARPANEPRFQRPPTCRRSPRTPQLPLRPHCLPSAAPLPAPLHTAGRRDVAMAEGAHRATLTDNQFGQGLAEHSEAAAQAEAAAGDCCLRARWRSRTAGALRRSSRSTRMQSRHDATGTPWQHGWLMASASAPCHPRPAGNLKLEPHPDIPRVSTDKPLLVIVLDGGCWRWVLAGARAGGRQERRACRGRTQPRCVAARCVRRTAAAAPPRVGLGESK